MSPLKFSTFHSREPKVDLLSVRSWHVQVSFFPNWNWCTYSTPAATQNDFLKYISTSVLNTFITYSLTALAKTNIFIETVKTFCSTYWLYFCTAASLSWNFFNIRSTLACRARPWKDNSCLTAPQGQRLICGSARSAPMKVDYDFFFVLSDLYILRAIRRAFKFLDGLR